MLSLLSLLSDHSCDAICSHCSIQSYPLLIRFSYLEKVAFLQEVDDSLCACHFALITHVISSAHAAHTALLTRFSYLEKVAFLQEVDARQHDNELRIKEEERARKR
jgi:hypothetical protein